MKHPAPVARRPVLAPVAVALALLNGCATQGPRGPDAAAAAGYQPVPVHPDALRLSEAIPRDRATTAARQLAAEGVKAMDARNYAKANELFNLALKVDINHSQLHLLNALAYHLRALGGEGSLYALAQQGYQRATEFDPSNAMGHHQLGLLFMDRRDYPSAVVHLMEAALYAGQDPDLLYDLVVAAYYAKDARTAYAALQGLRELERQGIRPRTLRASAIVSAAAGDDEGAREHLRALRASGVREEQARFAERRVDSWRDSLRSGMQTVQFQVNPPPQPQQPQAQPPLQFGFPPAGQAVPGQPPGFGPSPFNASQRPAQPAPSGGFFDKRMVMLDVAIVSTEEDNNDTYGVNLLDGLRLQFGNSQGTPAVSRQITTNTDLVSAVVTSSTRAVTRLISLPALTYSLNIANAQDRRNEVVARPSLVALGGQTSTFFSGTDVIGAAISTGQGGSVQVQKEAGVKLAVTPEFLPDDLIKLQVVAERTFLTNPNSNVLFDFRLDTSKTLVAANVVMKFGETLILSGLSERNLESSNSGVPVLRDIPLVQYLFNRQTKRDFHKSVLIIVTPRRPAYTNRSDEDVAADRAKFSNFERLQAEFEDKYRLWFKPVPAVAAAMKVLDTSPIYREFRSGDLEMESWTSRSTHAGRMKAALAALYY